MKKYFLILFLITLLTGCSVQPVQPPQPITVRQEQPAQHGTPIKSIPVKVIQVIDGDTFKVLLNGQKENVRFIGLNCPELSHPDLKIKEQPFGQEAAKYSTNVLLEKTVYLEFDVSDRDKYGRLLAYVWLSLPNELNEAEMRSKMFNCRLLTDGYSQVMTVPPNVKHQDLFVRLEREARSSEKGLWGI